MYNETIGNDNEVNMMSEPVTFKGNKDGIVMLLDTSVEFEQLCQLIVQKLWESRNFLGGQTALTINTGEQPLEQGQQLALKVLLQSLGHQVKRFIPEPEVIKEEAKNEEMIVAVPKEKKSLTRSKVGRINNHPTANNTGFESMENYLADGALIIRKNIRSGQKIEYDGTLIILGDVNAGAELVATGHILVLGTLRGLAHAGSENDTKAIVYAEHLLPLQLRIGELIARAPENEQAEAKGPEWARVIDQQIVIEEVY